MKIIESKATIKNQQNILPKIKDSKIEILADLKQSLLDSKAGKTFPIEQLWKDIDN